MSMARLLSNIYTQKVILLNRVYYFYAGLCKVLVHCLKITELKHTEYA